MPGYIPKSLHKYQHPTPKRPQHAPAKFTPIKYGATVQNPDVDTSPHISKERIRHIQDVVDTLLYYDRAVDPTLLATLSRIASRQSSATEDVAASAKILLDYVATHPNVGVRYFASDMVLNLHSDASNLSETKAKSRAGGHFWLGNKNDKHFNNGALVTLSSVIKHVMSSASEAELAALFYNCKTAIPLRITLEEMGHKQPKTPVTTDNSTAHGLIYQLMIPKASKSMDMRFHWLKCRVAQRLFNIMWRRGKYNRADYHTKFHPIKHYREQRPNYVIDVLPKQ